MTVKGQTLCLLVYSLSLIATGGSTSAHEKPSSECKRLKNLLPSWEHNRRSIEKVAKYCEIDGDYVLNLTEIATEASESHFIDIDVYFNCSSSQHKFGESNLTLDTI